MQKHTLPFLLFFLVPFIFPFSTYGKTPKPTKTYKPFIFYPYAGKNDRAFGAAAYKGVKHFNKDVNRLKQVYKIHRKINHVGINGRALPQSNSMMSELISKAAEQGYSPIILIGYQAIGILPGVVKRFPHTTFVAVDTPLLGYKNVYSVTFKEQEGSYLAGVLAAARTKTNKISAIGGMQIRPVERFLCGFEQGVKQTAKRLGKPIVYSKPLYIGNTNAAWSNVSQAKSLATNVYNAGNDVIFAVAALASTGVLQTAEEMSTPDTPLYAIGVDSNQDNIAPNHVLTSVIKRIDMVTYELLSLGLTGNIDKYRGKHHVLGLKGYTQINTPHMPKFEKRYIRQSALSITFDKYNRSIVTPSMRHLLSNVKHDMITGKINVKAICKP